ncbi:MAG: NfeD family protein [Chloroflexi bacterium]|nr:NfeD family protein [Ktedonobacteraceae bacterium]MBV9021475.1 NfeD family protein [Ktedonobacteraceae bacterium]MBV9709187.1 NfeD family protein [Chloroflexota bacterium]
MATDPLSLMFIACFLFGLLFLLVAGFLGNLGHGHSIGHGAAPHLHVGHTTVPAHLVKGPHITTTTHNFSLFSYINPTSLVLFLLGFGFFGYVLHTTTSLLLPLVLLLAIVSGCVLALLLLMFIGRVFGASEGATVQDVSDRTGLLGRVSTTIQQNGLGEILYVSPGGMRKSIAARSSDGQRIERGQEVIVIAYQGGVAEVDNWESYVGANSELVLPKDIQEE